MLSLWRIILLYCLRMRDEVRMLHLHSVLISIRNKREKKKRERETFSLKKFLMYISSLHNFSISGSPYLFSYLFKFLWRSIYIYLP